MKRQLLLMLALLALFASLVVSGLLYREMRKWYRNFNLVRLDPLGLGAFSEEEKAPNGQKPLVVFFGDSRAFAWPPPPGLERFTFMNRGVNGHTTRQCLLRFDAHVAPLEPDLLVLQVGVNDLAAIPMLPREQATIVAETEANVRQIVRKARALDTTVILTTIFPAGPVPLYRRPLWSDEVNEAITAVNAELRSLAGEGVIVLESAEVLASEEGLVRAEYAEDELHLNEKGYAALNRALAKILAEYPR